MPSGKLVRDRIPEIISASGGDPRISILDEAAYRAALRAKLAEEVDEFLEGNQVEELADVLEVVYALGRLEGLTPERLETLRADKLAERGGFERRLMLDGETS